MDGQEKNAATAKLQDAKAELNWRYLVQPGCSKIRRNNFQNSHRLSVEVSGTKRKREKERDAPVCPLFLVSGFWRERSCLSVVADFHVS